jgi:hypothetical protein
LHAEESNGLETCAMTTSATRQDKRTTRDIDFLVMLEWNARLVRAAFKAGIPPRQQVQ